MIHSLFLAHGSPMNAIEDKEYTRFLETFGRTLMPKAIIIFTAHWDPLYIAMGSADSLESAKVIFRNYEFGTLSNLCLQF